MANQKNNRDFELKKEELHDNDDSETMSESEWNVLKESILDDMYPDRHDSTFDVDATSGDFDFD